MAEGTTSVQLGMSIKEESSWDPGEDPHPGSVQMSECTSLEDTFPHVQLVANVKEESSSGLAKEEHKELPESESALHDHLETDIKKFESDDKKPILRLLVRRLEDELLQSAPKQDFKEVSESLQESLNKDRKKHVLTQEDKRYAAEPGSVTHSTSVEICINRIDELKHIQNTHPRLKPHTCDNCKKSYVCNASLATHMKKMHHGINTCENSNKSLTQKGSLEEHEKRNHFISKSQTCLGLGNNHINSVHAKLKPYSCATCNKSFSQRGQLHSHIQCVHSKLKPYSCVTCNKSFSQRRQLHSHIKCVHSKLKPYSCATCNKSFSVKEYLVRHIKDVHSKLKPYSCVTCNKSFSQRQYLDIHIKCVHNKLKPYICLTCNKSFNIKSYLNRHIKNVHSKLKTYICVTCNKSFSVKQSLDIHIKCVHAKLKPYSCVTCNKSFSLRGNLDSHIKCVHSKLKL